MFTFLVSFLVDTSGAHPLIHASRRKLALPEAEKEEEVKDVKELPLTSMIDQKPNSNNFASLVRTDRPHLRFQITSSDGFEVTSHSLEGEPCDARHS